MSDETLNRIEAKQDRILELAIAHETLLNHPETGLIVKHEANNSRITSLENSRLRLVAWFGGLSMAGGTVGTWAAKLFKLGETLPPHGGQ